MFGSEFEAAANEDDVLQKRGAKENEVTPERGPIQRLTSVYYAWGVEIREQFDNRSAQKSGCLWTLRLRPVETLRIRGNAGIREGRFAVDDDYRADVSPRDQIVGCLQDYLLLARR